jgi:hypothetical protein|eukprot:COSAG01_NODE_6440_length_3664_cov_7.580645_4_plen_308_part_00
MVDLIRQAKAGRRGDPLLLLREGSSLLPPQNYSLRQYQAPPPWELAGTGGYHPHTDRDSRNNPPSTAADAAAAGAVSPRDAMEGAGQQVSAAADGKGAFRQMLDEQVREKKLRTSYEQQKLAEEERSAHSALPSYFNSHRGGGGDARRIAAERAEQPRPHGDMSPPHAPSSRGAEQWSDAGGMSSSYGQSGSVPLHGRRSHAFHDHGGGGGGGGGGQLSRIEEEKSIEQRLCDTPRNPPPPPPPSLHSQRDGLHRGLGLAGGGLSLVHSTVCMAGDHWVAAQVPTSEPTARAVSLVTCGAGSTDGHA